ncbi:MAG: glycosyltransferase family 87 protein [Fimbriiglobus sp.]
MNLRSLLMGCVFVALLLAFGAQVKTLLADPTIWPPDDYVEYYAAGKLQLSGEDPYAPEKLLPLQVAAGRQTDEAIMMWNPPWTLPFVMPLGAMPARVGQLVWLLVGLVSVALSVYLLKQVYKLPTSVAVVGAAVFVPVYLVLQAGQIGPLLLLGAAGFVYFAQRGQMMLAGVAATLLAIKPHLAYLLWAAMLADAVVRQRIGLLAGGVGFGLLCAAFPLLFNDQVYEQYFAAMRDHPPAQWVSLTLGTLLRVLFGSERFALQFVPVMLGFSWFVYHWWPRRKTWDWPTETPTLLLVSFLTSPYGAWHFDLVLLLVCVLQRSAHPDGRRWMVVYFLANAVMLAINLSGATSIWFAWVAPVLAIMVWRPAPSLPIVLEAKAVPA